MLLSLIMLCTSNIFVLITYSSIVESFFIMLSVAGILYLRWKQPNMERPIKVSVVIPITFVIICAFLVIVPCYVAPYEVGMGVLITLTGVPFYFVGVKWQNKPAWFLKLLRKFFKKVWIFKSSFYKHFFTFQITVHTVYRNYFYRRKKNNLRSVC